LAYRPYTDGRTPWYKTTPKEPEPDFPHDYKVPSFGADQDMTHTVQALAWAEKKHKRKLKIPKKAPKQPEIKQLNLGQDSDIKTTF
jgi:hypothetical protein